MERVSTVKRRPGRPAAQWLSWLNFIGLPNGSAVLVVTPAHRSRLRGRTLGYDEETDAAWLATRGGEILEVGRGEFTRARLFPMYEPGDPVLRRGVAEVDWRGGVVSVSDDTGLVQVETLSGFDLWPETDLETPEDREARLVVPAIKPGPIASGPGAEAANQDAFTQARMPVGEVEPWAE